MTIVPQDWMPDARMSRIHVHWTAGTHRANAVDRKSYHVLVEGDGSLVRGDCSIKANEKGSGIRPLASHTLNANTGAIGVSMCGMAGASERPFSAGRHPLTEAQWERMIEVVADLARRYGILVTPVTILTHAEVHPNLNIWQRAKWDITRIPFVPEIEGFRDVGDRLRIEVAVKLDKGDAPPDQPPDDAKLPRLRVRGVAPSRLNFRASPNGERRGALPEGTKVERLAIDGTWSKVRTPAGHVGWVFSSYLEPIDT